MNAYMQYVKTFPESETKIFHLYVPKDINHDYHGFKESYYRVDYTVVRKDSKCHVKEYKFFKSLRLAKQFAKQKHKEFIA